MRHPLKQLIEKTGSVVIDGAMSTALEKLGCDLNHRLWSAKVLAETPEKIRQVHSDYFEAGANVAISASYQATEAGYLEAGYTRENAEEFVRLSVSLALRAKNDFLQAHPQTEPSSLLIAGGVGPYGAYLADGSEYKGTYKLSAERYRAFHALRIDALVDAGCDFLAFETQPNFEEAKILLSMATQKDVSCWITFTLKDEAHLSDGTSLEKVAELCDTYDCVDACGFNCVKRELVAGALKRFSSVTKKPLIVYPNSGETYDPTTKTWSHPVDNGGWDPFVKRWHSLGALCIGGCCRTFPKDITQIAQLMKAYQTH